MSVNQINRLRELQDLPDAERVQEPILTEYATLITHPDTNRHTIEIAKQLIREAFERRAAPQE